MQRKKQNDKCSYLLLNLSLMFIAHAYRQIWDQHDHNKKNNNSSLFFFCSNCIFLLILLNLNNYIVSVLFINWIIQWKQEIKCLLPKKRSSFRQKLIISLLIHFWTCHELFKKKLISFCCQYLYFRMIL